MAKLSAEERREAILQSAVPLFAQRGFADVTTREIAQAAGVSEALLYRHFPSKLDIYQAMQTHLVCLTGEPTKRLATMPDSTQSLVVCVYLLMWKIQSGARGGAEGDERQECLRRLLLRSVLEDGSFARDFLARTAALWVDKIQACLRVAIDAGDIVNDAAEAEFGVWMGHHIAVAIGMYAMPPRPVVEYPCGNNEVLERSVRFALRGLGMTPEALERNFNPATLDLLLSGAGA